MWKTLFILVCGKLLLEIYNIYPLIKKFFFFFIYFTGVFQLS